MVDLMLFAFRFSKLHLDCLWTTIAPLSYLEFYLLSFCKRIIVHLFKVVTMEEEVFLTLSFDEAKPSVCN